jgi:hypothetical protein
MHTGHRFFIVAPGRHRNGSGGRATHSPLLPSPLYPPPSPENTGVVGTMHSSSTTSSSSSPPFPPGATPSSSVAEQHDLSLLSTCDGGGAARPQPPTGKKRRRRRGGCPRRAQRPLPRRPCATARSAFLVTAVRSMVVAQAGLAAAVASSSSTSTSAMWSLSGLATEPLPSGWRLRGGRDGGEPNTRVQPHPPRCRSASSLPLHGDGGGEPPRCVWGMGLPLELLKETRPMLDLTETQYRIWVSSPLEIA